MEKLRTSTKEALQKIVDEDRLTRNAEAARYGIELYEYVNDQYVVHKPIAPYFIRCSFKNESRTPLSILRCIKNDYYNQDLILVTQEKHCNSYYMLPANADAAHGKVALRIVRQRSIEGFYIKPIKPDKPISFISINTVLSDRLQYVFDEEEKNYKYDMKQYTKDVVAWNNIQSALNNEDGEKAISVMLSRCEYEYEGFELINPTKVV